MKFLLVLSAILLFAAGDARTQQPAPQTSASPTPSPEISPTPDSDPTPEDPPTSTIDKPADAQAEDEMPDRKLVRWNEYEGPYFTIRFGGGILYDFASYAQDRDSKQQIEMHPLGKVRDFRFLLSGRLFPRIKRKITWSAGIMYDAPNDQWVMRQTGLLISTPEIGGAVFVGRTKEGFSLSKVLTGYYGWMMERSPMNDATIPILADGIKWMGYSPKHKVIWNLGYFNDFVSKTQAFSRFSSQVVGRVAYLPIMSDKENKLLHLGVNLRWGKPVDNQIRFRSRPEANPPPYFIDTGSFSSDSTRMAGYEAYYRGKRWFVASEYWWAFVSSNTHGDPAFHGGEFAVSYLFNDGTRAYNPIGGTFRELKPKRSVFDGGPGVWELVLHYSYADYNTKAVQGGTFGRLTSQLNWYLSYNVRMEWNYGYGQLDRFNLKGNTQFFQTRLQMYF